jgi:Zn-dependent protease
MLPDDTLGWIGFVVLMLLSLSIHEAAHAFMADRLGDPTARQLGRVTLNPLKHLHPVFSFLLPLLLWWAGAPIVGGGRPVPINVLNFRHKARDFMLVALAGPFSNLALVLVFGAAFVVASWSGVIEPMVIRNPYGPDNVAHASFLYGDSANHVEMWLKLGALLNLGLAVFNLLPLPPLDGSRVIGWLLPRSVQFRWYALDRLGIFLILGLLYFGQGSESGGLLTYVWRAVEWGYFNLGLAVDSIVGVGVAA